MRYNDACCHSIPARIKAKLGKGPDSIGNVLRVELGDEAQTEICSPLQEGLGWSVTNGSHGPKCVLDGLRSELTKLLQ